MDRRQKKTRDAIFKAFISLLSEKQFSRITVREIIDLANVGRATFYAHFETKDFLLKEMCKELFDHIFEAKTGGANAHNHIFDCDAPDSVILHLLFHLKNNDNNILSLFSCPDNELFMGYFRSSLKELIKNQSGSFEPEKPQILPTDFWINHIASSLVETIRWWADNEMKADPETIAQYFKVTTKTDAV